MLGIGYLVFLLCIVDMSVSISNAMEAAMVNFHLHTLNISFDLARDKASKFPGFLDDLEQRFWKPDTPLGDRLDLLKKTVCNFTWQKLQDVAVRLESSWIGDAEAEHGHACFDNQYMRPMTINSPLLRRSVRVVRNLSEDFRPPMRWAEVRIAFISRLMRDSNVDTKRAIKDFAPLTDWSMLDMHNLTFNNALTVHNYVGPRMDDEKAVRCYLRTIPLDITPRLQCVPRTVRDAQLEVGRLLQLQQALSKVNGSCAPTPVASFAPQGITFPPTPISRLNLSVTS